MHCIAWWSLQVTTVVLRYAERELWIVCGDYVIYTRPKYRAEDNRYILFLYTLCNTLFVDIYV